jgi:FkbM family methyltransferase
MSAGNATFTSRDQFLASPLVPARQEYRRDSFSQFGEDIIIEHLTWPIKSGFYVDVGCAHPYWFSNTCKLFERGWSGVNIDPNPEAIANFDVVRPRDCNIPAAIGTQTGEVDYYMLPSAMCNTLDINVANSQSSDVEAIKVRVDTLAQVLDKNVGSKRIHYMNVDCESRDFDVLQSNDWDRFRPVILTVEDGEFKLSSCGSKIKSFLEDAGYVMYSFCHVTSFFIDRTYYPIVEHGAPLPADL